MTDWTQCKPTVICLSENKKQKQLVESKMLLHMRFKGQRNFSTPSRGFSCSLLCSLSIYQTSLNFPEENTIIFRFINNKSNCFKLSTPSYNDQKEKKRLLLEWIATYSSYLLVRIILTWGMRSTQQPSDKHGASVWRLMREEITQVQMRWSSAIRHEEEK